MIFSNDLERVLKFKVICAVRINVLCCYFLAYFCQSKMKTPLPSLGKPKTLLPSYSRPMLDPDNDVNLSADITVGGVSLHFLSKFFYSLQVRRNVATKK